MTALLDSGFLLAVLDADDDLHSVCAQALGTTTISDPAPAVTQGSSQTARWKSSGFGGSGWDCQRRSG